MRKCGSGWADVSASDLAQSLQYDGNSKLSVVPDVMPRNAYELDFDIDAFRLSHQFQAHGFVDDSDVTPKECQRLAKTLRAGHDIEEDPSIARVCLFGQMEPEGAVVHRLCCVVEELCLPDCRYAMVQGITVGRRKVVFRQPSPMQ
jgi:hypothetical protein